MSVIVTFVGVVLGLSVGMILVRASASQFPGLGFVVPWAVTGAVVSGSIVVGVVAAAGARAARLDVIEAVGYE